MTSTWGVIPKKKKKKSLSQNSRISEETIDCRKPRMFSDDEEAMDFSKVKKISDLKNLGPASEKEFHRAGIKTPQQFQKMGWKKALQKLVKLDPKNAHSVYAYALIGALINKEWFRLNATEKAEAQAFARKLRKK